MEKMHLIDEEATKAMRENGDTVFSKKACISGLGFNGKCVNNGATLEEFGMVRMNMRCKKCQKIYEQKLQEMFKEHYAAVANEAKETENQMETNNATEQTEHENAIAMIMASANTCLRKINATAEELPIEMDWEAVDNIEFLLDTLHKTIGREMRKIA